MASYVESRVTEVENKPAGKPVDREKVCNNNNKFIVKSVNCALMLFEVVYSARFAHNSISNGGLPTM